MFISRKKFLDSMAVTVFGSLARGTAKFPGSDIAILMVAEDMKKLSFGERLKATMKAEDKLLKCREYAKQEKRFCRACLRRR
jgi:predicted nucleotidyltransferase